MNEYEYKISGEWTGPVSADRIRELVTNGTLNPYDFIRGNGEKSMISKHGEFTNFREDWVKLRSVRVKLDQLWKTKRDALLAKITGTEPEERLSELQNNDPTINKIIDECKNYWRKEPDGLEGGGIKEKGALNIEIRKRIREGVPVPVLKDLLIPIDNEPTLNAANYEAKRIVVRDWLRETHLALDFGVYVFEKHDNIIYVGQTAPNGGGFEKRIIGGHFQKEEEWCQKCTTIRVFKLNQNVGTGTTVERCRALERLILFYKFGNQDTLLNQQQGTSHSSMDEIEKFINSEINKLVN
jgi:hypothetical protein